MWRTPCPRMTVNYWSVPVTLVYLLRVQSYDKNLVSVSPTPSLAQTQCPGAQLSALDWMAPFGSGNKAPGRRRTSGRDTEDVMPDMVMQLAVPNLPGMQPMGPDVSE
mmetsp:Transcript_9939/g.17402  ORF Transcript_9939/g.17402 Transcript_9939/m.17402 type:complete len:107 (-) Transcript_9939:59-379(-)